MDSWEEGFDTWTPTAEPLASDAERERHQPPLELEPLKQALRAAADAVAAKERELDELRRLLEADRRQLQERERRLEARESALASRGPSERPSLTDDLTELARARVTESS